MKSVYERGWFRWALSALLAGVFMALCLQITTVTFLTNDDNAIAFALAGYQTGAPYPYALFTNCILGYAVSGLYGAFPAVPWWAAFQLFSIFLSLTVMGATLYGVCLRHGKSPLAGLALYAALLITLMIQPVVQLTYTVTGAVLAAAGAGLIAGAAGEPGRKSRVLADVLGAGMVLLAFLFREETGYPALCFLGAAVLYRMLKAGRAGWTRLLPLLLTTALLCGGALFYNKTIHAAVNGPVYTEFFTWRERFTDYPRDTYAENSNLYESVGWDEPLYRMADSWCFLDERINSETLQAITEGSKTGRNSFRDALDAFRAFIQTEPAGEYTIYLALLLMVYLLFACVWGGRGNLAGTLVGCGALLGGMGLCLYLCLMGRFMLRSFQVVALPLTVLLAVLALDASGARPGASRLLKAVIAILTLGVALLAGITGARELRANSPAAMLADCRAVNAYALAHPENTYVRDAYSAPDIDACTTYPAEKPMNLVSWGGCGMRSDAYVRQLTANDVRVAYEELFLQKNVYFLTEADGGYLDVLLDVLRAKYGAAQGELMDTFYGGEHAFSVYRLRF